MRWTLVLTALTVLVVVGCSGPDKPVDAPKQENENPPSRNEVHAALVDIHKAAVETCFGGFGKGAPYAMTMQIGRGKIMSAAASPLSDQHGDLPKDCLEKNFTGKDVAGTTNTELSARFAVENPDCDLPSCPPKDLPCTFKRDIACTVILD